MALISADRAEYLAQQHRYKTRLEGVTRLVQSRLNKAIQIPLNTVTSMQAFMLAQPTLPSTKSFDHFAAVMLKNSPAVDGIAFVDANRVIRHFYPLKGNERAIDLDLMTRPAAPYVEKAIREKRIAMNPPNVTVQGHLSTIARIPLYRDDQLLGLVQVVIDIKKTLQLVLEDIDDDTHLQLEDGGKVFWGSAQHPKQAGDIVIGVGDRQWIAKVWLDEDNDAYRRAFVLIWMGGSALLLALLFIVNRSFTYGLRLNKAVHAKTAQLAASEARWRSLLEQVHLVAVGLDRHGCINYVNPYFCKVTGFEVSEVIGKNWFENFLPKGTQDQLLSVFNAIEHDDVANQHLNQIMTRTGEERSILWFNVRMEDDDGEFDGTVSIGEDITTRQELENQLDYLAYHDTLTDLPNRALFLDRLEHAVKLSQRDNKLLAILMIDLDQFKNVNDSLGHLAGDMLLQVTAQRLHGAIRASDTVARLGGDEFGVLLESVDHIDVVEAVASKILDAFSEPVDIEKNKLFVSASVGIVMYPMADDEIEDLLRAADTAMYHAKAAGRNCYRFYEASMATMAHSQLMLANKLRDAIQRESFSLEFQPIVELTSRKIIGFESLLRWQHDELGWISPAEFIPVAESTGSIQQIGYWVLRNACRSFKVLQSTAGSDIYLAVNVSSRQFRDSNFISVFVDILEEEGMLPEHLVVEITESQLMEDAQRPLQILQALRDAGCRIAIDDFGTGYSSLNYLRLFPVDILKIDRSFIADLTNDSNSKAMLKAVQMIAESLEIEVLAEGIETQEQLDVLRAMGINLVQGFYLGKPQALAAMRPPDTPS